MIIHQTSHLNLKQKIVQKQMINLEQHTMLMANLNIKL